MTPQRSLCNNPQNTFSKYPILTPLHSCPLNLGWQSCSILHWEKHSYENSFSTKYVSTASVLPVRRKKLTLQLYFLPPMSSALTICAFPSTSKHTLQKTKPKTFPYTHVVLADSISQIVLSFLCTFLLSSQPLHIAGPWLHLKHSTFIHKNLLGWFYSVS